MIGGEAGVWISIRRCFKEVDGTEEGEERQEGRVGFGVEIHSPTKGFFALLGLTLVRAGSSR